MSTHHPILQVMSHWFKRNFSDPGAVSLFFSLILIVVMFELFGHFMLPALLSGILAYLLFLLIHRLICWHVPRWLAMVCVYVLFVSVMLLLLLILLPLLIKQIAMLSKTLPHALMATQTWVKDLVEHYPRIADFVQIQHVSTVVNSQMVRFGQSMLQYAVSMVPNVVEIVLYFILVPILVFFFLKDGPELTDSIVRYFPSNRGLMRSVWGKIRLQLSAYVRGRAIEVVIVALVSTVAFLWFGLPYAVLCGVCAGLSVLVPYVGAVVIYFVVFVLALFQGGVTMYLLLVSIVFAVILFLDGYVLQPWLFSEVMDLSPLVVILSVLFFGGLWGFWGVFFAIPLAGTAKIVVVSWPSHRQTILS